MGLRSLDTHKTRTAATRLALRRGVTSICGVVVVVVVVGVVGMVGVLGSISGCADVVDRRAEQLIADALPRHVGPAARYAVRVGGADVGTGRLAAVGVQADRIQRPGLPVIDHADVQLADVVVDRAAGRIASVGRADAQIRILGADLAAYLVQRRWFVSATVALQPPDAVLLRGVPGIAGIALPARSGVVLQGRLRARGTQLWLDVDAVQAAGVRLPTAALLLAGAALNPIVDLATETGTAQIDAVSVDRDALQISASAVGLVLPPR